jgi:hypothetical protein
MNSSRDSVCLVEMVLDQDLPLTPMATASRDVAPHACPVQLAGHFWVVLLTSTSFLHPVSAMSYGNVVYENVLLLIEFLDSEASLPAMSTTGTSASLEILVVVKCLPVSHSVA